MLPPKGVDLPEDGGVLPRRDDLSRSEGAARTLIQIGLVGSLGAE